MSKAIVGIAKSSAQLEATLEDLRLNAAVSPEDVSVLMPSPGDAPELGTVKATKAPEGATTGAVTGGVVGGALGLLAGIGMLAIPGLGPFIAAGPIMAALGGIAAGATTGGVVGALIGLGIPEYEAKAYQDRLKAGGYLLAVHTETGARAKEIRTVLENNKLDDISSVTEEK